MCVYVHTHACYNYDKNLPRVGISDEEIEAQRMIVTCPNYKTRK